MSILRTLFYAVVFSYILTPSNAVEAPTQLLNSDFEEDIDNVGFPDGWTVNPDADVSLTQEEPSSGRRALIISQGYAAASQNLEISSLAGKRVAVALDARSPDNACLGVRIGYYVNDAGKGKTWVDVPMIWDKILKSDYQALTASRVIPENALDGRFWFGIYRSKREGVVVVDNINLEFLDDTSSLSAKETIVAQREREYFLGKLRVALSKRPNNPELEGLRSQLDGIWQNTQNSVDGEGSFEKISKALQSLNTKLLTILFPERAFVAGWKDAFERLDPAALPTENIRDNSLVGLSGETLALGAEITNTSKDSQDFAISMDGVSDYVFEVQMRRQVLMETWYTKGSSLLADPLTLLKGNNGAWAVTLEPGETVQLYASFKLKAVPQDAQVRGSFRITAPSGKIALPFELKIFRARPPTEPVLAHYQFLYTNMNVVNDFPEKAKNDLESHGVTDIEWPFMPPAKFSSQGALVEVDWSTHDRWLAGFKNSDIRLNIFWQGSYKNMKTLDGKTLVFLSPEWRKAFKAILTAYLDHAVSMGIPRERFTILPKDEIHSKSLDSAPDHNITEYVEIAKIISDVEPELLQYLTIGNYAFPADIKEVVSHLNVAMPHWPRPETLGRNAPADYKPREEYNEKTLPLLKKVRDNDGLELWSYHVLRGKSDDVLLYSRAYPFLAVASELTGFGYWAYNVTSGSSWDDLDGNILDYSLIYDGRENHSLNRKYNPTEELIVPSIQWEAIRAGQQDGQIFLYLVHRAKEPTCPPTLQSEIGGLLQTARQLGGPDGDGCESLTFESVGQFSALLRDVYVKSIANDESVK